MIALQSDVRVYPACGYTDMRRGMQGLAMLVQQVLAEDPFNGALYAFRGRRGNLLKLVWHDGIGLCMLTKRLERAKAARFERPALAAVMTKYVTPPAETPSTVDVGQRINQLLGKARGELVAAGN